MTEDHLPLFVYGPLQAGGPAASLLRGLARAPARVRGKLYRMPAGYPVMARSTDHWVEGELLDPPGTLRMGLVDRFEGVAEGCLRRTQMMVECRGRWVHAWAYLADDPRARGGQPGWQKARSILGSS